MLRTFFILGVLFAFATPANAALLTSMATQSIHIRSDGPNTNYNVDTDFEDLIGGNGTADSFRALYQFSLSPLLDDLIAEGGGNFANLNISSVTLTLFERRNNNSGVNHNLAVYNYGFNFVETVSSWNDPDGNGNTATGDTTPGGTFGSTMLSSASYSPSPVADTSSVTFPSSADFINAVFAAAQGDGTLELMVRKTNANTTFVSFASDEYATNINRQPTLSVNFTVTPVPEPSTWALLAGSILGLPLLRRKFQ
jgi:hypothetical protein